MKKVVIFGGGTGLSQLLKGLRMFPVEITSVVTVADNGKSTGKLREEYLIPAVGDVSKVLLSMSHMDQDIIDLMNYRFTKSQTLGMHSVKNLLLTALLDLKGNFNDAIPIFCKLLDIDGNVLPLTEESVHLIGTTESGLKILGEEQITKVDEKIVDLEYDKEFEINKNIYDALDEADLIIFSSGSILTSIMPHIIIKKLVDHISKAKAKKLYVCNLFTQPGETDGYKLSDHVNVLEKYIGKNNLNAVIVNNKIVSSKLAEKYLQEEQKDFVLNDKENLENENIIVIDDNLLVVDGPYYRHDSLKTAYHIYSYMMELDK